MDELKKYREMIDRLDKELVDLFIERMNVVTGIADYKKNKGLPIYDQNREKAVIEKVKSYTTDDSMKEPVARLYTSIMEISKDIQNARNK
ncbi:MAG TPA: chorismate mutase [Clostridiales bacterium]|nr:chorismate mutase [Clostridiales bacterium]